MTQKIDPARLKAAAEHLEWVCQQYPDEERVQSLLQGLRPLIEDAKDGKVAKPLSDNEQLPFQWAVSAEGLYRDYRNPSVEGAYYDFAVEMEGGLTEQDQRILADMEAQREAILRGEKP